MRKQPLVLTSIRLEKYVHGGQALGAADDGRKIMVWGGLPGERVDVRVIKKRRSYLEGVVETVHEPSPDRVVTSDPSYLSTSPWQTVRLGAEWKYKDNILRETFEREGLKLNWKEFFSVSVVKGKEQPERRIHSAHGAMRKTVGLSHRGYRNKMEFSFWGDGDGLHLAHFVRGSHKKQIIDPDTSALPNNDVVAGSHNILHALQRLNVRAGDLKTVIIRSAQDHKVAYALFVKDKAVDLTGLTTYVDNVAVYYSDPKSPASIPTELIYSHGDIALTDTLLGQNITYDVLSFFQVNLPVFEQALNTVCRHVVNFLARAKKFTSQSQPQPGVVDMYSGVGTIGLCVGADVLVESDARNAKMARINAQGTKTEVVHASSEQALKYITAQDVLIVDPPRAGLHKKVVARILEVTPPMVIYLSCNPSTQARDVALLHGCYSVSYAQGFNFFPRTPHIESLVILQLK